MQFALESLVASESYEGQMLPCVIPCFALFRLKAKFETTQM